MITPREGSTLYYSLLWTPPAARQRFLDRLNLIQTLGSTLDDVQEPQVAERKIHWWHEELQRLFEGNARHPAAQALQVSMKGSQAAMQNCLSILTATSTSRFTPAATEADADRLLEQSHTARLALLAEALTEDARELNPAEHSAAFARAMGKHAQLTLLPQLLHRGHPVFSTERYQQFSISPTELAKHVRVARPSPESAGASAGASAAASAAASAGNDDSAIGSKSESGSSSGLERSGRPPANALESIAVVTENPARQALLEAVIKQVHDEFSHAVADSAIRQRYRRPGLMPLWRLLVLREKQLALWHRSAPDLLRERSTLTPLHKLFWAWRNRR